MVIRYRSISRFLKAPVHFNTFVSFSGNLFPIQAVAKRMPNQAERPQQPRKNQLPRGLPAPSQQVLLQLEAKVMRAITVLPPIIPAL